MVEITPDKTPGTGEEQERNKRQTKQILKGFGSKRGNLIPILQKIQGKLGYLPREAMLEVALFLDVPEIDVYGVALKENDDGTLEAIYTIETELGVYEEETTKILPTVDEVELIIRRTTNSEY